ncbi:DUF3253 domain-containing protein [Chryseobacterium sp. MP_3.2]|uniref:DUF3253 domain-containing protein n=1 Tax=Chryseobacterium sp. MP_3.2 TaxID=3071712 RepID=UPI002DF99803|nr:hypothetical protein [Chryseobacterium sp. MP_3.2]
MKNPENIKNSHLKFAEERGSDKTYCPSEVARKLFPDNWREMMEMVREIGDELVREGQLEILQKGVVHERVSTGLKGPIRFRKK